MIVADAQHSINCAYVQLRSTSFGLRMNRTNDASDFRSHSSPHHHLSATNSVIWWRRAYWSIVWICQVARGIGYFGLVSPCASSASLERHCSTLGLTYETLSSEKLAQH
jgi:hypothetical protein